MKSYEHHPAAHQAAQSLVAELASELPGTETGKYPIHLLEQYLANSDRHRLTRKLAEYPLLVYIRDRAAEYYELHYQQPNHDCWQSIRIRSRLEIALVQTMGNNAALLWKLMKWHSLRFAAAINANLFVGKLLHQRDEPTFVEGAKVPYTARLN